MRDCSGILNYVIGAGGQRPLVGGWQPEPDHKKLPAIDFRRVLAFLLPSTFLERVQEAFCVAY